MVRSSDALLSPVWFVPMVAYQASSHSRRLAQ